MKGGDFLEFKKNLEERIKTQAELLFKEKGEEVYVSAKNFLDSDGESFVKYLFDSAQKYDELLTSLNRVDNFGDELKQGFNHGIIALNGTSGVGQSFVMKFIKEELKNKGVSFDRIYLLATRTPRSNEGDRDPYIFVNKKDNSYECIFSGKTFSKGDVYLEYESRPGAFNAILMSDLEKSKNNLMYLETVIPTLLKMKNESFNGFDALGDDLRIAYLAADSGKEWLYRLVAREPDKISDENFRNKLIGRVDSSLKDMYVASKEQIPSVVHVLDNGHITAKKVLTAWNIL